MSAIPYTPDDLDTLVRTLYGEARGESIEGQTGVAWVVRNRVEWAGAPLWWGATVEGVCRKAWQFSTWNSDDPNLPKVTMLPVGSPEYAALADVARGVLDGTAPDPTGHGSHYERTDTAAAWARGHTASAVIGRHSFYSIGPRA